MKLNLEQLCEAGELIDKIAEETNTLRTVCGFHEDAELSIDNAGEVSLGRDELIAIIERRVTTAAERLKTTYGIETAISLAFQREGKAGIAVAAAPIDHRE